jgi:hypothetical protein
MVVKALYTHREDNSAGQSLPATSVHLLRDDETHQEQMRRLHNARATQRAARHHRINRTASL